MDDNSEAICVEVDHPDQPLLVYGSIIAYAVEGAEFRYTPRESLCALLNCNPLP